MITYRWSPERITGWLTTSAQQQVGDVVRPHDLRHTCASLHIPAGTPVEHLPEMLGHTSVASTTARYGHLHLGGTHRWVDALGADAEAARAALAENRRGTRPARSPVGSGPWGSRQVADLR